MPKILHCKGNRKAHAYWLYPQNNQFHYEILLVATCPQCRQTIMEWYGFHPDQSSLPCHRVSQSDHPHWQTRIQTHLAFIIPPLHKNCRDTRATPLVSQFTRMLSLPVDRNYRQIIQRLTPTASFKSSL